MAYEFSGGTTQPPYLRQSSAVLGLANGSSVACWFLSNTVSGGPRYIAGWGSGSRIIGLAQNGNKLTFGDKASGAPISGTATTANTFAAGGWNHAVGIVASNSDRRVILNGDLASMGTVNPGVSFVASTDVWVGANIYELNGFANGFDGKVAGLAIYSEILPDEAIVALARGAAPELVRPHKLEFLTDLSGRHSPEIERIRGTGLSLFNSPAHAAGPRLFRPRRRLVPSPSAGDGGTAVVLNGLAASGEVGAIAASFGGGAVPAGQAASALAGQVVVRLGGGSAPAGVSALAWLGQVSAGAGDGTGVEAIGCAAAGLPGTPAVSWSGAASADSPGLVAAVGGCRIGVSGWSPEGAAQSLWSEAPSGEGAWHPASTSSQAWLPRSVP